MGSMSTGHAFQVAPLAPRAPAPTPSARDRLILEHHGMVRAIARRMARNLPSSVEVDELVNIGLLGLIDAIDRFDADRGVPFRAYAEIRIRGANVDSLRGADWTPRGVRQDSGRIEAARTHLRNALGRMPTREELALALGVTPTQYDRLRARSERRRMVSLDAPVGDDGDGDALLGELVADDDAATVLDRWEAAEAFAGLAEAVDHLSERERLVVTAYYQRGIPLREIGATLGVTESRVCQIHGQALKRLQRVLTAA